MNDKLLHTPEGVRDIYNSECKKKLQVMEHLHHILELYSYHDIQTPTFEYFDIFNHDKGSAPSNEMYKFFDRDNNTLVLRPDITPSIARCVAKYYEKEELPVRLCYQGNTFINKLSHQGKLCEVTQLGGELVNDDSSAADAEIIATVVDCFAASGLEEYQIEIGQVDYFRGIIEEAGIDEDTELQIRDFIYNKNFFGLEEFVKSLSIDPSAKKALVSFNQLFGGIEMFDMARELVKNKRSLAAIDRLEKVYRALSYYHYEEHVSFDLSMLSGYNYYTGIIFYGYTYGTGDAIVKGGRYNDLMKQFGKEAPAIGFAFMMDELMMALSRQNIQIATEDKNALILYPIEHQHAAIQIGCNYRAKERRVELIRMSTRRNFEDYVAYAKVNQFFEIIYVTDDEKVDILRVDSNEKKSVTVNSLMEEK